MNTLTSYVGDKIDSIVYDYLSTLDTKAGYIQHVTLMMSTSLIESVGLLSTASKATNKLTGGISGVLTDAAKATLNELYRYVLDPNIDGIVIHASSEKSSRDVTVAEKIVLSTQQDSTIETSVHQNFIIDNAVPHLRTWDLDGYIISLLPESNGLLIKDELKLKIAILDAFTNSRKPVLYKTHDGRFYKVLIKSFEYEYEPRAQNGIHVTLSLREYKTVDIRGSSVNNFPLLVGVART